VLHDRGPALRPVKLRESLERRLVFDLAGRSFDHEVEILERDGDDAARMLGDVATLSRPRATREIDIPVDPEPADSGEVRSGPSPRRGEPIRSVVGGQLFQRARPRDRRMTVDVEVLPLHLSHLRTP